MRSRHDGTARLAVGCAQHGFDIESGTVHPGAERRRCEQPVEAHRERHAILRREELVEIEHAQFADGRVHHHAHEHGQVEVALRVPLVEDQVAEQNVLAAAEWVGLDVDQTEQAGHEAFDLVADDLRVGAGARRLQRADDVQP